MNQLSFFLYEKIQLHLAAIKFKKQNLFLTRPILAAEEGFKLFKWRQKTKELQ